MALFIDKALLIDPSQDAGKDVVLKLTESELSALGVLPEEIDAIACGTYRHKTRHEISSSGYVVHSLEAALWSFWHSTTFAEGALLAANLGMMPTLWLLSMANWPVPIMAKKGSRLVGVSV
nr:ADP-ribosylglycohydrolase family protein [Aeromonas caviae]